MKRTIKRALSGAAFAMMCTMATADTVPLAIVPPFHDISSRAPVMPVLQGLPQQPWVPQDPFPRALVEAVSAQANVSAFGVPCDTKLAIHPTREAMLHVTLSAPCRPDQMVRISHAGLEFDLRLPMTGERAFHLPALEAPARVTLRFLDGVEVVEAVDPGPLDAFMRVALQVSADDALRLKASARGSLPVAETRLGDDGGGMVQIISHHIDPDRQRGVIRLALEAKVLADRCDRPSHAKVVERLPGLPLRQYGISLGAAGCDRVGDILELKNILQDLKLAAH
jgi:hypothetical protein